MKHFALCTAAIVLAATGSASAQRAPFNEIGVTMGHWHLNSKDVEANKKILVAMGGNAIKPGDFEIVNFPGINVFLHLRPGTPPATGGTDGSVINHVGFLVPDLQAAVATGRSSLMPAASSRFTVSSMLFTSKPMWSSVRPSVGTVGLSVLEKASKAPGMVAVRKLPCVSGLALKCLLYQA